MFVGGNTGGKEKQKRQRSDGKLRGFMSMYSKTHYDIVKQSASIKTN